MRGPPGYTWIVHGVWRRGQSVPLETQGKETGDVLVAPFLSARTGHNGYHTRSRESTENAARGGPTFFASMSGEARSRGHAGGVPAGGPRPLPATTPV